MDGTFIAGGLIASVVAGIFIFLGVAAEFSRVHWNGKWVIAAIVSLIFGFTIFGITYFATLKDEVEWNNGICPDCKVEWRFINASRDRRHGTYYYYVCDSCGKIIEQMG